MKIALIGYGKMGKAIAEIALERGHEIILKVDVSMAKTDWKNLLSGADVAIEFTTPESAVENMNFCFDAQVPVVVGSTGWYDHFETIKLQCEEKKGCLFYATNFSLGVNIMFDMNSKLAKIMSHISDYKVSIEEIHHTRKLDAPSGTAISLAEQIIEHHPHYAEWNLQEDVIIKDLSLPINSKRENDVPGTHYVKYVSEIDAIGISHEAYSRKGFALGAVLAAEFSIHKTGIYNMSYLINQIINHGN